jgi:type I restriction enzyme R subunit
MTVPVSTGPFDELWALYERWRGIDSQAQRELLTQPYHTDGSGKEPRYYQRVAINRTIEAIARGQQRILLVMATGTGKTYTAFQIIWRLWKAKRKKHILFLADRNILIDQTIQQAFAPFGEVMHKIRNRKVERRYEIYLSLYQAVTGNEEWKQIYRQFPPDFFDLVVIDECHRGSAAEDSAWREVLDYFQGATHLGLTATPKEKRPAKEGTLVEDPGTTSNTSVIPSTPIRCARGSRMDSWGPTRSCASSPTSMHSATPRRRASSTRTVSWSSRAITTPRTSIARSS